MKKIIFFTVIFLVSFITKAQVSEDRTVNHFSKLKASTSVDVFYTLSDQKSIKVTTDDNEKLQLIKTKVDDGTLKIYVDTDSYKRKNKKKSNQNMVNNVSFKVLKVEISGPALESFETTSSAEIKINGINTTHDLAIKCSSSGSISGSFKSRNMIINTSSSSDFIADINTENATIETSSSSDIELKGYVNNLVLDCSSSSDCDLKGLKAKNAKIKASSSSDVIITVVNELEAHASSSAEINYYGNPSIVKVKESSSGKVTNK
ncbi:MAG: head GIN domain-containing protein [Flavobacteriales bacterium]